MIDTRTVIDVEDYPEVNPDTDEGREELSQIGFWLAKGRTPIHFVFHRGGKEIGEMIVGSPLTDALN